MNENNLATELLHEIQASAKRWFIAFVIMFVLEVLTIFGFMWYLSLPVEVETIEVEADEGSNANYIERSTIQGDINNGTDSSNADEKTH